MINKINNIISGNKTVFQNFIALGFLQGTNFLIPLILMPYLTITIGIDGFGLVSFIQVIMIYFATFTDYGFNISATRDISINKEDNIKISKIFSTVLSTKIILSIISAVILAGLVYIIPKFRVEAISYALGFIIVLGQSILPIWFFQGMEKMKYITYLNLITKLIFTLLIFIFVNAPEDYPLVLLFYGLGNFISGIIGVFLAIKQFNLNISIPRLVDIKLELKSGWSLFIANFSTVAYISSNLIILGFFTTNLIVGYYTVAEKIIMAMRQLLVVFSQAIYPHICKLATESHSKLIHFYKQIYIPFIILFLGFTIAVFFGAELIVKLLAKNTAPEMVNALKLLCFVPLIVGLNIPAYQTLLAHKFNKSFTLILTIGSILNIIINLSLVQYLGMLGTIYSVIITETLITIGLHLRLKYSHNQYKLF